MQDCQSVKQGTYLLYPRLTYDLRFRPMAFPVLSATVRKVVA